MLAALIGSAVLLGQCADETMIPLRPRPTEANPLTGMETFDHPEIGVMTVGGVSCTATLIAPNVVVSSAHCVGYGSQSAQGDWGRFFVHKGPEEQALAFVIDRYVSSSTRVSADDIALLHLATSVSREIATPACLSASPPSATAPLALFGYGCARRDVAHNRGAKVRFDFANGQLTSNLCPGDSGGPVMLRSTGAIVRISRVFSGEMGASDTFANVASNSQALLAKVREWGSVSPMCGANGPVLPAMVLPPVPNDDPCGRFAGTNLYSCISGTEMVRCMNNRLEQVSCANGCVTRPGSLNDVCAPAPTAERCDDWSSPTRFSCNHTGSQRTLCLQGRLLAESCDFVCNPVADQDAICADSGMPRQPRPVMDSGVRPVDSGVVPRVDVVVPRVDTYVPPVDSYVPPRVDSGVNPIADSGSPMVRPPGDVTWTPWPSQHNRSNAPWGTALTDIIRHLPLSYGDTYADSDLVTYGHETTHGINSHARNNLNRTGRRANGFYCMNDRVAIVAEPAIRKSAIAMYVPNSLRGTRFALYITGSPDWDDTPLYVWDEWVAYTNGSEVAMSLTREGLWRYPWRDAVAGTLEFVIYALATAMAVEVGDAAYFRDNAQFRAFLAWNARRSMELFRAGASNANFQWAQQDQMLRALQTSPDAAAMREFARRVFGRPWAQEVLGLDP